LVAGRACRCRLRSCVRQGETCGHGPRPVGSRARDLDITVIVPDEGDDAVAREYGVARAKDLARQFGGRTPRARLPWSPHSRRFAFPVPNAELLNHGLKGSVFGRGRNRSCPARLKYAGGRSPIIARPGLRSFDRRIAQ
jgi:hypothetical protein